MSLEYNREKIPVAKELRRSMTPQENHIWYDFLRDYPIRFQRQKTIREFIADFYCHKARLIIEVDGSQHETEQGIAHDQERSAVLEEMGLKVIRFSNLSVDYDFISVRESIHLEVKSRIALFEKH